MTRTNQETLNWLKLTRELNLTESQWHEEAKTFFGQFENSDKKRL